MSEVTAAMDRDLIAIIPARGGSKRIPEKNVKALAGKPMIAYTIAAARESGLFDRVVVSTDSGLIAKIAQESGAEVPFLRSGHLADDFTPVSAATADALLRLDPESTKYASVAQLMPCCPLRNAQDVRDSYRQFVDSGADSQISVVRYGWQNPWWAFRKGEKHQLEPVFKDEIRSRSQDLPELFCPCGAIWWSTASSLRATKTFHIEKRTGWEIPWQRGVDIDNYDDWQMAEILMTMQVNTAAQVR